MLRSTGGVCVRSGIYLNSAEREIRRPLPMQKALDEVNAIYRERESTIESLHAALQREIPLLVQELHLTTSQAAAVEAYIEDRGTSFE